MESMSYFRKYSLGAKVALGVLVSYTSYASLVALRTHYEITQRSKNQMLDCDCDCDCDVDKYKSLTIAGRFENPFPEYRTQTVFEFFLSRVLELFEGKSRGGVPSKIKLRELLPIHTPDFELLKDSCDRASNMKDNLLPEYQDRMTFTWLGQSCAFLQISGVNILTDPIFSNYLVNPVFGPKRITESPCDLQELPKPQFVLVSHNHPDHLDKESMDIIKNESTWVVPSGMRHYLASNGIYNTIELDWWDKVKLPVNDDQTTYEVVCTPAMHWSGRKILDSNKSLWCSFLILRNGKPIVFHAGDTGYVEDLFKMISNKYGAGTLLAMLPCGQYCPQWHQKPRHINPEECFKIMKDLNAKKMVGIHWGTFVLSSEHFLEPKLKLEELAKNYNKVHDAFTPDFGRTLVFDLSVKNDQKSDYIPIRDGKSILVK